MQGATLETRMGHDLLAEPQPLRQRVEIQMMGEITQRGDIRLVVGGRIGDDVFVEMVAGEPRLPQARGATAVEIVAQVGKRFPTGKALEREHELATRRLLDLAQDGGVAVQGGDAK